jgi:hypothetical protein
MTISVKLGYDYDDFQAMTQSEVMATIQELGCDCVSFDDPGLCYRCTDPADYAVGLEIGSPRACECDCHDIWAAWINWEQPDIQPW